MKKSLPPLTANRGKRDEFHRLMKVCLFLNTILLGSQIYGQATFFGGIVGGSDPSGAAYAALVSPSGTITQLQAITNLTTSGQINSVSINKFGFALVGGEDFNSGNPIAAVVSPSGGVAILDSIFINSGSVNSVSVNNSGLGVIGGSYSDNTPIAFVVDLSNDSANPISSTPTPFLINGIAINDSNQGIMGGTTISSTPEAAIFTATPSGGTAQTVTVPAGVQGVLDVAINNQGFSILGGQKDVVIVSPNGTPGSTLVNNTHAFEMSVAINNNDTAIATYFLEPAPITGSNQATYLSPVSSLNPTANPFSMQGSGFVDSVSLNNSGNATASSGNGDLWQLTPLTNVTTFPLSPQGGVNSVSINNAGSTLLGGNNFTGILSPSHNGSFGTLTALDATNLIFSVSAIYTPRLIPTRGLTGNNAKFANYLNRNVPLSEATQLLAALSGTVLKNALQSASFTRNAFGTFITQNVMFGLSQLISSHLVDQRFFHTQTNSQPAVASLFNEQDPTRLTADLSDRMQRSNPCNKYSFWIDGFGEYNHLKSQDQTPSFNAYSGAALIGFDIYSPRNLFGVGAGYAYTHLIENDDAGVEKINYYLASLYDTVFFPRGYVEFGAWGAYDQIHNYRHISFPGFDETASATIKCWQLVPHFGFGVHREFCWGEFEPFGQLDCAINWQQSFREHGAGPFDMRQKSQTSELLRAEGGIRFYQSKETSWGAWMIMERLSYVYLKTFNTGRVTAAIAGTPALLTLTTFRGAQNLGSAGLELLWRWGCRNPVTLSFTYDGEWGSKYMSQEGMVNLMKDF